MSAIFISHSSKDSTVARELNVLLEKQGHRSVFLDFDPELGIPAGRDWEQELYAQLRSSHAVIVLCSPASMQSNWCFAEITHAKALGKHVFPIKVGDCVVNGILTSAQVLDLTTTPPEEVYKRLFRGLVIAGLDPASMFDWDGKRPPYPGLVAFDERDAGVFFGREAEIQKSLELLTKLRRYGGSRMLIVLGASGSGKSSLMKAGIIPRLRRDVDTWLVVPSFRPGIDPLRELAISLAGALETSASPASIRRILDALSGPPADAAKELIAIADQLRIAAGHRDATVVLPLDQMEELLTYSGGSGAGKLLPLLEAATTAEKSPLVVLATLRSDFLGELQLNAAARTLEFEPLQLGPISRDDLYKVIERPAEMAGFTLEKGLAQAMIEDTETDDALPLLAFTLRELYEKFGDDKLLKTEEYRKGLGGLAGSVAKSADAVFEAKTLTPEQRLDLRRAFRSLVRVNEQGQYVRQPADRASLPASVREVLERFVEARLLISRGERDQQIIEVAHEALFRSWDRLKQWLEGDREFLLWQQRLRGAAEEWERTKRDEGTLLRGAPLAEAESHLETHRADLGPLEREFIESSVRSRDHDRAERERIQKRNNRVLQGFLAAAVALMAFAGFQWNSAANAKRDTDLILNTVLGDSARLQHLGVERAVSASWKSATYLPPFDTGYVGGLRGLQDSLSAVMSLRKLRWLSPMPIFLDSTHGSSLNYWSNGFGHYNPDFVIWAGDNLLPAAHDAGLRRATAPFYKIFLLDMVRNYHLAYQNLHADTLCHAKFLDDYGRLIARTAGMTWRESKGPGDYIRDSTARYFAGVDSVMKESGQAWATGSSPSYSIVALGFWLRREMDSTHVEFRQVLDKVLTTYDAVWFADSATKIGPVPLACT